MLTRDVPLMYELLDHCMGYVKFLDDKVAQCVLTSCVNNLRTLCVICEDKPGG